MCDRVLFHFTISGGKRWISSWLHAVPPRPNTHTAGGTFPVTPLPQGLPSSVLTHILGHQQGQEGPLSWHRQDPLWLDCGKWCETKEKENPHSLSLAQVTAVFGSAEWRLGDGGCSPWYRMPTLLISRGSSGPGPVSWPQGATPCQTFTSFPSSPLRKPSPAPQVGAFTPAHDGLPRKSSCFGVHTPLLLLWGPRLLKLPRSKLVYLLPSCCLYCHPSSEASFVKHLLGPMRNRPEN